ncbi:LMBR1 domain-containing protein 2 [Intoshia linei]|uniref:LMBR1 domain-containing protein 2 n=1 Tax=Intoshia linei TaxID=1819745 RepID=A0A177B8C9_9BILA|nr:LMBR1 domain-containing protein 2 [Intoshia linei]
MTQFQLFIQMFPKLVLSPIKSQKVINANFPNEFNIIMKPYFKGHVTLLSWGFSFLIIFYLPIDISETTYRQCLHLKNFSLVVNNSISNVTNSSYCNKPFSYVNHQSLVVLWRTLYWTMQVLTWLLLPAMKSYVCSGEFRVSKKILYSIKNNILFYGAYLLACIAFLIYLAVKSPDMLKFKNLMTLASAVSTTYGIFFMLPLLGYGLVNIPRHIFFIANYEHVLTSNYFQLSKINEEFEEAKMNMREIVSESRAIDRLIPMDDVNRKCIEIVLLNLPPDVTELDDANIEIVDVEAFTESNYVNLNRRLIQRKREYLRTKAKFHQHFTIAKKYRKIHETITSCDENINTKLFRFWHIACRRIAFYLIFGCMLIMTFVIIWSECTFFISKPILSIFTIFHLYTRQHYLLAEGFYVLILSYMCYCTYSTVFNIKFLHYYYLSPDHLTDSYSLLFCGSTLCRLMPALCLNFLCMLQLDNSKIINKNLDTQTAFTEIMGHLSIVPFITNGFNIYFPILLIVICFLFLIKIENCLQRCCGIDVFSTQQDDDVVFNRVENGRLLVELDIDFVERQNRQNRRRNVNKYDPISQSESLILND